MTTPLITRGRVIMWGAFALLLIVVPLIFNKSYALSLLSQMGIMTLFALSYNMLLGQTGLLSFGHAAYYGLGAFATIHALNAVKAGWAIPVSLLPAVGGLGGLLFGLLMGYVTTRRAGTTFAMITLGIGELVASLSLMLPLIFGGEAGISGNRVVGAKPFGISFGPQIQMYYLIASWVFVGVLAMYALTQTPLGRMANAVRDNPERAQFVGYDPQTVRYQMVVLAGFFAGLAGGLAALTYEIVTAESLGGNTSATVLLATYVGGIGFFFGPIIGAVLITLLQTAMGGVTQAWPFYFGTFFLIIVLYAPGGIASLVMLHKRLWETGQIGRMVPIYARMSIPTLLGFAGTVMLVEMGYHLSETADASEPMNLLGVQVVPGSLMPWMVGVVLLLAAFFLWRWSWNAAAPRWKAVSEVAFGGGAA